MQLLSERESTSENAWGEDQTTTRRVYAVEAADVGVQKEHYLGHRYAKRTFQASDVGRKIEVATMRDDPNWMCWHFCTSDDEPCARGMSEPA